ncbi:MAG: ATP synthase F1 subunit epsilon [Coriobacteriia bacterium]|nr:ATP synthase F1 subunit epsilon [Coriobacteriia bacterium]
MARTLLCEIVTPEHILYTNEVEMVVAPALDGELGILPLHAPMVAALKAGEVRVKFGGDQIEWFAISGGYLQVHEDKVIILADDAVASGQIDIERARQASDLAAQRLAELRSAGASGGSAEELDRGEAAMKWAQVQLSVGAHK